MQNGRPHAASLPWLLVSSAKLVLWLLRLPMLFAPFIGRCRLSRCFHFSSSSYSILFLAESTLAALLRPLVNTITSTNSHSL
jgi:hypothetical protein